MLCIGWRLHIKVKPFHYAFQNAIESWLYFANVMTISLGGLYTLFSTAHMPDTLRVAVQPIVEVVMVLILVLSFLGAAFYLNRRIESNQAFPPGHGVDAGEDGEY